MISENTVTLPCKLPLVQWGVIASFIEMLFGYVAWLNGVTPIPHEKIARALIFIFIQFFKAEDILFHIYFLPKNDT